MNYPVSHVPPMKDPVPGTLKHPPKEENLKQEVDEDQYATDTGITCPMIGIRPNSFNVIAPDGANCQTLMDVTEHHTLPIPIFLPTSVKCGNDPDVGNTKCFGQKKKLFETALEHELRTVISSNRGLKIDDIKSEWLKFSKGKELPSKLKSLETIMDRYGCDESPTESYVGGNLATLKLNDKRYLIHSVGSNPLEWDATLCLTRMTASNIKNHTMDTTVQLPLNGGTIYQVAIPRQRYNLKNEFDPIFATRQLNTTRLWKVEQSEIKSPPTITMVDEHCNSNSPLRCIDLNPYIWGEVCELRSDEFALSQEGFFQYKQKLENQYDYCSYMGHPKTLVLSSRQEVVFLDTRRGKTLQPIFSLTNQDLSTYYNVNQNENIVCFSTSSHDNIIFICTETCLLIWDIRKDGLPLSKTAHLMECPPNWIESVQVCSDKEWLFLDSQAAASSCMLGLSWGSQQFCLKGSSVLAPSIEIEPRKRWTSIDTLEFFQLRGLGLEWCTQNRFKEMRSGLACDKENDGTIQIWQCTFAGDVFSQQVNVNERIGPNQQKVSKTFVNWVPKWMDAVREIEEDSSTANQIIPANELFESTIDQRIDEEMLTNVATDTTAVYHNPLFAISTNLEQHIALNCTELEEWQDSNYIHEWEAEENTEQAHFLASEETFAHDFEDDLISSTPLQPKSKVGALPISTPAPRAKQNYSSTSKPCIASTPVSTQPSNAFVSKSQKVGNKRVWDDF